MIPLTVYWTIENKGAWGLMHINGIIITNSLYHIGICGAVGRAHMHVGYIFLKSNEEIVVWNPKVKIFLLLYL